MKNKLYMAAVALTLCTALIAPTFSVPVIACEDGKEIIFEEEIPPATALWGKSTKSKYDGKLMLTNPEILCSLFNTQRISFPKWNLIHHFHNYLIVLWKPHRKGGFHSSPLR